MPRLALYVAVPESLVLELKKYDNYKKLIKGSNWQQPFLMDIVAKEIFFHDNILFVEGQEDVGLLKQDNQLSDSVNLFGYGVRGINAFEFAFQLAKDLGVKKAGVLLDAGVDEDSIKNELETNFTDVEYKVIQWNKEDIRDKERYEQKRKTGYFDRSGVKKPSGQLDDFDERIEEINSYFD